ncbi:NAD(P)/FAD-dependent oxidoreductase [Imbroritus primus]|uniref:NAD(P)/FAD-dependent oxidoreductase n=1 Tax=Imbroritus primus TaxID=3058603 RepID=A0ACD3SKK5_9BURK|nr:NAD(P)/FAD-dependent oxidoreductase [Burkholderiaceae bacterium PBA]
MRHVIVGDGPAGIVAAETLRRLAPADEIVLLGDEPEPPYSRMAIPYLLMRNIDEPGTHLRKDPQHLARLNITHRKARMTGIDVAANCIHLQDGATLAYGRLLLATGSVPVRPPIAGIDDDGVRERVVPCWTLADARRIAGLAAPGARVVQMGAGFIGCIIMEALAARGVDLTVVEMGNRMVPRMMTEGAGAMIRQWVQKKGVAVHTGTRVDRIAKGTDAPLAVTLSTGETLPADLVISATGVTPNLDVVRDSGLRIGKGIVVDECMRTSVDNIYAAGDVAEAVDFSTGELLVNAIQPNAVEQARIAASNMAGRHAVSQGGLQINVLDTLGLISSSFGRWWGAEGGDHVELSDPEAYRYMRLEFLGDRLIGATSVGLTEHVGVLRGLIQTRTPLGAWKAQLKAEPLRVMDAYLAQAQARQDWPARMARHR